MKGSRAKPLYETAVREASVALTAALEDEGVALRRTRPVVEATVRAYLAAAKYEEANRVGGNISQLTRDMAKLEPGQSLLADAYARNGFDQRKKAVRRLMNNDQAAFFCRMSGPNVPDGKVRISRAEDGARFGWDGTRNKKAVELAAMRVGEHIVAKEIKAKRGKGALCTNTKHAARKLLGKMDANWRVYESGGKLKIERTA